MKGGGEFEFETASFPSDAGLFAGEIVDKNNNHNNGKDNDEKNRSPLRSCKSSQSISPVVSSADAITELLECPVCTDSMFPPIFQCQNGHTICSNCKPRVHERYPTCRSGLGDIRCLALEKVATSLQLPCKYNSLGCSGVFTYYDKIKHEQLCDLRPYNCRYAGSECSVVGDISCLVSHLREHHKVDMHNGSVFNHRYVKSNPHEVVNATWMLTVFNCFGHHFCLQFEAFELGTTPVYMAFIRFMGDEDESQNFRYNLEVGGCGRKVTWQGVPISIHDSHQKVRDSHDGLIIHRKMALAFSGGDRKQLKLRLSGKIWREEQIVRFTLKNPNFQSRLPMVAAVNTNVPAVAPLSTPARNSSLLWSQVIHSSEGEVLVTPSVTSALLEMENALVE